MTTITYDTIDTKKEMRRCPDCEGTGYIWADRSPELRYEICDTCEGMGYIQ